MSEGIEDVQPLPFYKRIAINIRNMSRDEVMELGRYFAVTLALWLVGYMHFSFAWIVMILMIFVSWQFEIEKKTKHRENMVQAHMSSYIDKIQNPPSWVYFSDKEHAEWINKMLLQMWPYVGDMAVDILKNTVEPEMQKNLPKSLNTLYFDKITLGNQPPIIQNVVSYDGDEKKGEFILDLDLKYEGDAQVKLSVKNVKLGLTKFKLNGILRVIFKPLVSLYNPIGGVTVFFLNRPKTKFDLTNLLNVLDFPGLNSTLRRIVDDTIASFVVLPNRVAIPLAEGVDASDLQYPIPQGVLRVKVVEARDLVAKDFGVVKKGKSDPYAILEIGAQKFRTKVKKNDLNPTWNETFEAFVDNSEGQDIDMFLWDEDKAGKDSKLGFLSTQIASAVEQGQRDVWLPLQGAKTGRAHLHLSWFPLSDQASDLKAPQEPHASVAALFVKVVSAESLPQPHKKAHLKSVFCEVSIAEQTNKTFIVYGEKSEWNQGLRFFVRDPANDEVEVKVIESKGNRSLGRVHFNLRSLIQKPHMTVRETFKLEDSGEKSTLTCRFTLRMLKVPDVDAKDAGPRDRKASRKSSKRSFHQKQEDTAVQAIEKTHVPVPILVVNGVQPVDETHHAETGSDQGSVYDDSTLELRTQDFDLKSRGELELNLKYDHVRNTLVVKVISARNLRSGDAENKTNPFVRLYLLPDRSKKTRRVTKTVRGAYSGMFNEVFEYAIGLDLLGDRQLACAVKSDRGLRNRLIGETTVDLGELELTDGVTLHRDLIKMH
ncbi:predicted protein [Nematostella vectensis]|uniref:Uncharacterized protein n=1 Tax=Nematostella vectensis TaxID=45351 RepID=A7RQE8_NEMVE|nr:predicted protein [Nematostella vectensis]|eukprot:XP_001638414.1 predicted protein [Nematostella vectensis]